VSRGGPSYQTSWIKRSTAFFGVSPKPKMCPSPTITYMVATELLETAVEPRPLLPTCYRPYTRRLRKSCQPNPRRSRACRCFGLMRRSDVTELTALSLTLFGSSDSHRPPRHVLSTHCNAVAVDSAVDKEHAPALQSLKLSVEGRRTRARVEGRPVIPETVEKGFHRFLRSQSEAKDVFAATFDDHVHEWTERLDGLSLERERRRPRHRRLKTNGMGLLRPFSCRSVRS
jgi:hypothetical protein